MSAPVLERSSQDSKTTPAAASRPSLVSDVLSSLVVFLIALPLCMGIAIASGVPPALGLATGIIGGLIVGSIAGSPLQVSGPAAGLAVIVFELVQDFGLAMLGPVLLVAGLIQILAGALKVGRWFRAMSPAVVYGMLAGIGVLICAGQFHVMVDDKPRPSGLQNLLSIPESFMKGITPIDGSPHHLAAGIGLLTIATIILWNRFRPKSLQLLPGALIAVVLSTGISVALALPIQRVNVPTKLWESFTLPTSDMLLRLMEPSLFLAAVALAVVASAETLLSAAAVDRMHNGPATNYDRELMAQGVGNALCGVIGALPMTGVIVRSSANVQAGAKTRMSAIFHGVWLLLMVLLLPGVLRFIPTACLAGILVHTGFKLINPESVRKLASYGKFPVFIYAATVIGIVVEDLLTGVLIGLALTVVKLLYKATHLEVRVGRPANMNRVDVYLEGTATFLRLPQLAETLDGIEPGMVVHLHFEHLHYIDHTCLDLLRNWCAQYTEKGGSVEAQWDNLEQRYHLDRPVRVPA